MGKSPVTDRQREEIAKLAQMLLEPVLGQNAKLAKVQIEQLPEMISRAKLADLLGDEGELSKAADIAEERGFKIGFVITAEDKSLPGKEHAANIIGISRALMHLVEAKADLLANIWLAESVDELLAAYTEAKKFASEHLSLLLAGETESD
jgi:hypothetical protein